jgi:predicted O-methyltransferase YrrM
VNSLEWFERKFARKLDRRSATFRRAFELLLERTGALRQIVETGCVREKNDFSAGYSTVLFGEFLSRYGGRLESVDVNPRNVELCRKLTGRFTNLITVNLGDSVDFLRAWPHSHPKTPIDLLYLDSLDYPIAPKDGPREPSQQHCLAELEAALPSLAPAAIVLIDDADLPGGGKARLARERLSQMSWRCVLDDYQTLWTRDATRTT